MELNRALIKSQAKQLIKNNVCKLFIIILVVGALTGVAVSISTYVNNISNIFNDRTSSYSEIEDFSDFDSFIDSYENQQSVAPFSGIGASLSSIASIFLSPLTISLAGLFLMLIRGKNMPFGDSFTFVFKNAFDKNYLQKVLTMFLTSLFTFLWSLLFIIPGIVYMYKVRFVPYIVADNPNMDWREAIDLSKKMTNGHKGELFVLDLSYIPWYLLMSITFGLVGIYVLPYIQTTYALYYENFKQRGFQNGELTPNDFVSEKEKMTQAYQNQPQYQPPQYQAPQAPQYQPPQYQAPQAQQYQPAQQEPYTPPQEQYYQPPQEQYYQPPQEPNDYNNQ